MYGAAQWKTSVLRVFAAVLAAAMMMAAAPSVSAAEQRYLVPVGHAVGVKLFARGVLVVKLPEGASPAKACGLKNGDVIVSCGGKAVQSTEQFRALLQEAGEEPTPLQVNRSGRSVTLSVEPAQNQQGDYAIGAWIRDSMAGIGTVTYYDPQTKTFGALGHGITDVDTAVLMPFSAGSVLPATVKAVKRGEAGCAGELRGDFVLDQELGTLDANTAAGIFGRMESEADWLSGQALPVAEKSEVQPGRAVIRSNVRGDEVREYEIEILKVQTNAPDGRDLVISVTDPELVAATGGIVQGMSGSPIIQDGRLVGAVTHVCVYG